MFQTKGAEKMNTHILCSVIPLPRPRKSCRLWDNAEKYATDGNMAHARCMIEKQGYRYTLIICNTYCFSTQTTVAATRPIVTLCVLCVSCYLFNLEVFIKQYLAALHTRKERKWRRKFALWTVVALRPTYSVSCGGHQWHVTASGCTADALTAG